MKQLLYFICIIFISVVSCKKDETKAPSQPAPGTWLLSKIYAADVFGGADTITRLTEEFIYNGADKMPSLDIGYYRNDTAHLDSLFYDAENRLIRVGGVFFSGGRRSTYLVKTIHYGADGKMDSLRTTGGTFGYPPPALYSFKYTGSTVMQYQLEPTPAFYKPDSFRYSYNNGNLIEWKSIIAPSLSVADIYAVAKYDNCNNVLSYLNMNVYLPFGSSIYTISVMNAPILSKNNPLVITTQRPPESIDDVQDVPYVTINEFVKDSTGLIVESTNTSVRGDKTKYRYEYIPGE